MGSLSFQVIAGVEQAGGIKKFLFNLAFQSKKAELERFVTGLFLRLFSWKLLFIHLFSAWAPMIIYFLLTSHQTLVESFATTLFGISLSLPKFR